MHKVPISVLRAVFRRMQFTLRATRRTPHGASRLVQAMSAWLVKTLHASSRHSRDARVYGHTTTAVHKLSTPTPPLARRKVHHRPIRQWNSGISRCSCKVVLQIGHLIEGPLASASKRGRYAAIPPAPPNRSTHYTSRERSRCTKCVRCYDMSTLLLQCCLM